MSTRPEERGVRGEHIESIPEIRPWREIGWIFKDGDAVAIERQGEHTRARSARLVHPCDE